MGWISDRHMRRGGSIGPGGLSDSKKARHCAKWFKSSARKAAFSSKRSSNSSAVTKDIVGAVSVAAA